MAETGQWNGHIFTVSPSLIRGFSGLTIKGSSETKVKTSSGKQQYVTRKAGKPAEISITITLSAFFGCDVRNEAVKFVEEARAGAKNYFYVGNKKIMTCQLMLTDASVEEIEITPKGTWTQCTVKLNMKQSSKDTGSAVTIPPTSRTAKKATVKPAASIVRTISGKHKTSVDDSANMLQKGINKVNTLINNAKKETRAAKKPVVTKGGGSIWRNI